MLLYIMLYIVLAYLMLFAALTNAVCLNNASWWWCRPHPVREHAQDLRPPLGASSFFSLICANAFYFHALSLFISFF